ncbi:MAG: sigma-70 family RNA polymerase sigma factor [Planctomycetota bacterium]
MGTLTHNPDSSSGLSLAIRLRKGSADAWHELVDLYGPLIASWCRQAGLTLESQSDVGQEVLLAVFRGIGKFDPHLPHATFRGWLWKITRNAVMQSRRRIAPQGAGGSTALGQLAAIPDPWAPPSWDEPPSNPDDTAMLLARALNQIRQTIEPLTWNAFWNTAVLGHSAPEVAAELGMTSMAVRQAKSRLLRRLRQQLGDA